LIQGFLARFPDGPVGKFEKADKSEEFSNVAQEIAN